MRKKWEYKTASIHEDEISDNIKDIWNALGTDGWELVSVIHEIQDNGNYNWYTAFFKREIID